MIIHQLIGFTTLRPPRFLHLKPNASFLHQGRDLPVFGIQKYEEFGGCFKIGSSPSLYTVAAEVFVHHLRQHNILEMIVLWQKQVSFDTTMRKQT